LSKSLEEVTELLTATQQSWSESMLKLPRAEDYEPLAAPLREFARVAPVFAETLAESLKALRSLSVAPAPAPDATPGAALAAAALAAARTAIRGALDGLPHDEVYGKFAAQLRELATVSPSLMEWMRGIPSVSRPLGDAVDALKQAAADLESAEGSARRALGEL